MRNPFGDRGLKGAAGQSNERGGIGRWWRQTQVTRMQERVDFRAVKQAVSLEARQFVPGANKKARGVHPAAVSFLKQIPLASHSSNETRLMRNGFHFLPQVRDEHVQRPGNGGPVVPHL